MDVWVGYVTCGRGHEKAAQAIAEVFKDEQPLFYFNLLDFTKRNVKFFYERGYRVIVKFLPTLWSFIFNIYRHKIFCRLLLLTHTFIFKDFIQRLTKQNPKVVVTTHFFIAQIVARLKAKRKISTRLITVITDFGIHPLWINEPTDYYIVATRTVASVLCKKFGINEALIKIWGIPLRSNFYKQKCEQFLSKYKKPKNVFTLLLFSSDFGIGPLKRIIKEFYKKCGIVVIYAKNMRLKAYIETIKHDAVYLLPFAYKEEIWELMDISDLVITKAGGLSLSEAIFKGKPTICMYSIYGQESYNIEFMISHGLGFYPKNTKDLICTINRVLKEPGIINQIQNNLARIKKENCPLKIKELIQAQVL